MNLKELYGENCNESFQRNRIEKLKAIFKQNESCKPEKIFSSSGRAEILGNHTDHNHGLVMVAAISCDILAAVKKTDDRKIKICSENYAPILIDLNDTAKKENESGTSAALTRGIAEAIKSRGFIIGGFTAYLTSDIFKGAGVSSSAAYEVLIAEILNNLYLDEKLSSVDKAVISQYAENVYFGKPCGLLDQSGIAIGSLSMLDFNVPDNPIIKKLNPPKNYTLVITNTGGDHAALTPHYAAIRSEMEEVAAFFGKKVLRDVPYTEFFDNIAALKEKFSGRAILRAMHFYNENKRVLAAETALEQNNTAAFLNAVNGSGISSLTLLQNCYVPGDTAQPVVLGIELSRNIIKDGAVRVHGGGFAGSILACVCNGEIENYAEQMKKWFGAENVFTANIRKLGTAFVENCR